VFDEPVPLLYVVRFEYQPGIVVLSVHTMLVPVCARVSKFSVRGEPSEVMLPPLVTADELGTKAEIPKTNKTIATKIQGRNVREVKRGALGIERSFQKQVSQTKFPHVDPGITRRQALGM
jgi:hypothetical protein